MDRTASDPFAAFRFATLERGSTALNECHDIRLALDPVDFLLVDSGHLRFSWFERELFSKFSELFSELVVVHVLVHNVLSCKTAPFYLD